MIVTDAKTDIFQKKIAYIADQQLPVQKANTEQIVNTISALAMEGLNIDLIIPKKWRNLGTSKKILKKNLLDFYNIKDGFDVAGLLHVPFSPFKLDKFSHGLIGPVYASITNHEIIYTRNFLPALIGVVLRKKVVFETFQVFDRFRSNTVKFLAKLSYSSNFLSIITHSIPSKESLIKAGVMKEKITVIPNGFNPEPLMPPLAKTEARQILGWNRDDKIACYAGRIDIDKGVTMILELAQRTPEIKYVLIGYSEYQPDDWIVNLANQKGLKNITRLPWVTIKELSHFLFAADVLIIPPTADPMAKFGKTVLPMKTFIYMAAGRCILAPALVDTTGILNEKNAVLVAPDDLPLAQEKMRKIFEDEAWRRSISKRAQLDSQNYTWQSRAKRIIAWLNERLALTIK